MTTGRSARRRSARRADPVEDGHLDVHHHQVGPQLGGELDGPGTVGGLTDDLVPLLGEHLREVHADQGSSSAITTRGAGRGWGLSTGSG